MASWQAQFFLVPSRLLSEGRFFVGSILSADAVDSLVPWLGTFPSESSIAELQRIWGVGESWHKDMKVFGNLESHCVCIDIFGPGKYEISARFDLRSLSDEHVVGICNLARNEGYWLLSEEFEILEPTRQSITRALRDSNAFLFVTNPTEYFRRINRNN